MLMGNWSNGLLIERRGYKRVHEQQINYVDSVMPFQTLSNRLIKPSTSSRQRLHALLSHKDVANAENAENAGAVFCLPPA